MIETLTYEEAIQFYFRCHREMEKGCSQFQMELLRERADSLFAHLKKLDAQI